MAVFSVAYVLFRSLFVEELGQNLRGLYLVTWLGFALFLGGCGAHHIQHANDLRNTMMAHSSTGEYAAAIAQVVGEFVCLTAAIFLIYRWPNRFINLKER